MKLEEIRPYVRAGVYVQKCSVCKKKYTVLTQEDREPEYYTDIYVLCDCGEYIEFVLPVN